MKTTKPDLNLSFLRLALDPEARAAFNAIRLDRARGRMVCGRCDDSDTCNLCARLRPALGPDPECE